MTFSLTIDHCPWIPERRANVARMLLDLLPLSNRIPYWLHDVDYDGKRRGWASVKHEWALAKWRWHTCQDVTHCVMLSDDLAIMPRFWDALGEMVSAAPHDAIGLMSNHPDVPRMLDDGVHWYRCDSWLVGPAIVMPRNMLRAFVDWYERWYFDLPTGRDEEGYREWYHDDSSINEWLTKVVKLGSLHPVPAPIEHILGLGRSHDLTAFPLHAAEWASWRRVWHANPRRDVFSELGRDVAEGMREPAWWAGLDECPKLEVV